MTSRPAARKRQSLRETHAVQQNNGVAMTPKVKVIDAGPPLEQAERYGIHDQRPTYSKLMGFAGRILIETIPQWFAVGAMLGLIFGGCCSNVRVFCLPAAPRARPRNLRHQMRGLTRGHCRFLLWRPLSSELAPTLRGAGDAAVACESSSLVMFRLGQRSLLTYAPPLPMAGWNQRAVRCGDFGFEKGDSC